MSIADYIEEQARSKQREIKYEIWKAKNHDSRMRTQGALIGALVGVSAGILLAPKSGKETREDIGEAFDETVKTVKETTNDLVDNASDMVDNAKDSYEDFKYRAYTDLEPVREGFEQGREIAKQTGSSVAQTTYTITVKDTIVGHNVTSSDIQGATQTGTPTFTSVGDGSTISPSATSPAKLVAADGSLVETLTVANEGTYTINPETGVVTFKPLPTFTGPATPVTVKLTAI